MIDVANNCFSKNEQLTFVQSGANAYTITASNAFVINNNRLVLEANQLNDLLSRCFENLLPSGVIIIIGGAAPLKGYRTHRVTEGVFEVVTA
jgi:hypothetical protein